VIAPLDGRFIDAGGVRTYVIERGAGPTVVLLHGASLAVDAWLTWYRTIGALAGDFRTIAFDQIGFGRSDPPPGNIYLNRLERVPHAWAVLDALGLERVILVGHSEGAFMAARMATEQPERIRGIVLVTSGGTSPRLGGTLDRAWMAASDEAYDVKGVGADEDGAVRIDHHLRRGPDPDYEAILRDNYRRAQSSGSYEMFQNLAAGEVDYDSYTRVQEQHLYPFLPRLRCRVLLIWARQDPTVPVERGLKLMDLIPGAALHVLGGAGHMVMHDQPAAFHRLLRCWCAAGDEP
jgi:pimeloyl-ACP methyl ester carboxylesterase